MIGTAVSDLFSLFIWFFFMLRLLAFLALKTALNCRNVKHVKLYLSKKRLKIAAANGPHRLHHIPKKIGWGINVPKYYILFC